MIADKRLQFVSELFQRKCCNFENGDGGGPMVGLRTKWPRGEQGRDQCVKNPFPRAAESACEAVEGLEPGSPADAGAGRDRQPGRDLTLSSVRATNRVF